MKIHALIFAAIAACLSVGASAAGNPYDQRGDRYERHGGHHAGADGDYYRGHQRQHYRHHHFRHHHHHHRHHDRHRHFRGAGPDYDLGYGDRLPAPYWGKRYRVDDWQRARLGPPMHGYHWVRIGADYVQVSAKTGVITVMAGMGAGYVP